MTYIELVVKTKDNGKNTFLIDVVHQRLRRTHDGEKPLDDSKWWKYHELKGTAKPGETLTIIWCDGKSTKSLPILSCSFPKL